MSFFDFGVALKKTEKGCKSERCLDHDDVVTAVVVVVVAVAVVVVVFKHELVDCKYLLKTTHRT